MFNVITLQDEVAPVVDDAPVEGSVLFVRILSFIDDMAKDQVSFIIRKQ